jgi:hypothetical protein
MQLYLKHVLAGKCRKNFSAQETSVPNTSGRRATKLLKLQPCKTWVVHALKKHDPVARTYSSNGFLYGVHDGELDAQIFLSDEAWFCFRGEVTSHNSCIGVKKIQDIFTNSLLITKRLVFGVR